MYTFLIGLIVLSLGYIFYSRYIQSQFQLNLSEETPAYKMQDGVDFIPMPLGRYS